YIFLSKEGPFSLVEDDIYQQLFLESMTAENEVVSEMKLQDLDWYVHEEAMLLFTIQSEVHVVLANGVEMDISKNGHFGTYSWLSLQDNREEKEYPEWDFEYLNENKDVEYEEFQKVFKASEHANMFWFTGEALQDKRLDKLVSNLKYLEYLKQTQEKFRFIQIVHFLQKVKDMEALMEASRFSGIATYNIKGEPLLFNHTFLNLLGKSAKVKKIHELFTSLESWKNFEEKLREEEGFLGSIDLVKDDSNILPAQVACSLRLDDTGRSVGYLLIIRDESHERRLQRELELSYLDLEKKVIERTKELKETLDQVEALKKIQDGDYFLTSLLITPLGQNVIQSPYVQVESFLKQKKSFLFKEKYYEIGGDINIAHKLTLKNRSHILFMNADAMGKSIQGAGGVLVLGSV
ncbi:MAG: PAS domain-containing protein, partial [Leptospiraceae bacterium]|nr:PAS domain-containing protein [Leptospiraceae bacterium]